MPHELVRKSIKLFGEHVIPNFPQAQTVSHAAQVSPAQ